MSATGRARSRSVRESFSKLCKTISGRRVSKDSIPNLIGVEPEIWEHSGHSSDESTESYSSSYNSSHTELSEDDARLENFLMPSRTLGSVSEDEISTVADHKGSLVHGLGINTSQPFRFLDLPLEIRRMIYKHYFPQQGSSIRVKRGSSDSEIVTYNPWRESQAILSTCREIYQTAKEFSELQMFTLDLSQHTPIGAVLQHLPIPDIMAQLGNLASKCTRVVVSQHQFWDPLEPEFFPLLAKFEIWDYKQWRELFQLSQLDRLSSDLEGESRSLLRRSASSILAYERSKMPPGVKVEVNLVCELLVGKGIDEKSCKLDKLRHVFTFGDGHPDGRFARSWARDPSIMGPLPFAVQMAQHMHQYCSHLQEHEPELLRQVVC